MFVSKLSRLVQPAFFAGAAFLIPSGADAASLLHRWNFDNANDSVGGANATLVGTASVTGGQLELPGGGGVRTNYASVPGITATLASNTSLTVETWFTLDVRTNWAKVWMFGTPGVQNALSYIDLTPYSGLAGNIPKIDFDPNNGPELNTGTAPNPATLLANTEYYVATVYDSANNLMSLYINGALVDSASMGGGNITQLGNTAQNFFGAAVNFGDPDMDGRINEMRIWNNALTPAEIAQNNILGPNTVPEPGVGILALLAGAVGLRRRRKA